MRGGHLMGFPFGGRQHLRMLNVRVRVGVRLRITVRLGLRLRAEDTELFWEHLSGLGMAYEPPGESEW